MVINVKILIRTNGSKKLLYLTFRKPYRVKKNFSTILLILYKLICDSFVVSESYIMRNKYVRILIILIRSKTLIYSLYILILRNFLLTLSLLKIREGGGEGCRGWKWGSFGRGEELTAQKASAKLNRLLLGWITNTQSYLNYH